MKDTKLDIYDITTDVERIKAEEHEWSFEEALSHIGIGKIHYFLTFITGLMLCVSMTETTGMNFVMKSAECDLQLSSADKGLLASIVFVGITSTAFVWGYLSDTRGRKNIMKWTLLCASLASILSSFAPNFTVFAITRFFVGVFLSASIGSAYPYLGEFTPAKNRQIVMSIASYFFGFSQFYTPAVAWLILPTNFSLSIFGLIDYRPWRALIVLYALPGLIAAVCLFYFPESPKYHMAQGKESDALEGLAWIYSKNTGKGKTKFNITKLRIEAELDSTNKSMCSSIVSQVMPLLKPPYIKALIISFVISFSIFFGSAALGLWFMEIKNDVSTSTSKGTLCEILNDHPLSVNNTILDYECDEFISETTFIDVFILGCFYTVSFVAITCLMTVIKRGWISCSFLFTSGICGIALFYVKQPTLTNILLAAFITLSSPVISVVTGTAVLLFPTNQRAMAVCIILTVGRVGCAIGTSFIGSFIGINCQLTMGVLTGFVIGAGLLNFLLPFS